FLRARLSQGIPALSISRVRPQEHLAYAYLGSAYEKNSRLAFGNNDGLQPPPTGKHVLDAINLSFPNHHGEPPVLTYQASRQRNRRFKLLYRAHDHQLCPLGIVLRPAIEHPHIV